MIKVENISKSFESTEVLKNVSFEIEKGEFVAIMGPSGSGKSTLLYSISGMDKISSGRVLFDDISISDMKEEELSELRLAKMGFVFQSPQMLRNLTVFDNIILPGLVAKKETPDVIRDRGHKLMVHMEIEGIRDRDNREVSGGQLQRASICRAMINHPEILFLDEPTGALNSEATEQVLDILEKLNDGGMTILTVSHDQRVASKAKKVLYIIDGRIAACKQFEKGSDKEQELSLWLQGLRKSES
ncbi:ABC transporter ATP-binding protein [Proteiniclasticum sp.]|uniref:ABC transporter ATP-binding protein n=1 Tax=Proteiniclasticum sp. TaxID=2053595 RepID=UPI0028977ADE|nr:ABC transporter ATP-binding protein [Proteiniclasticum sp.]